VSNPDPKTPTFTEIREALQKAGRKEAHRKKVEAIEAQEAAQQHEDAIFDALWHGDGDGDPADLW